jgi:uncharacterized membrane protein YfcA
VTWWHGVLIAFAGLWAGTINTVVGSGTLVTFPVLVALGYPPVTATTSNALGLVPGSFTGAWGYRREITGARQRLIRWSVMSALGAVGGTILLLSLPPDAFETIVPFLVGVALVLVVVQPYLTRRLQRSGSQGRRSPTWLLYPLIFLVGVYGGYFTAAQGIMLVGVMGLLLTEPLQRLNGYKNVLAAVVNLVAGAIYAVVAPISWPVVAILAVSSTLGGLLGARIGRRLSPTVLRAVIVVVGLVAIVRLVLG